MPIIRYARLVQFYICVKLDCIQFQICDRVWRREVQSDQFSAGVA